VWLVVAAEDPLITLDQPYRPGVRGWQKLRTRITAEAIVGGVTRPVHAPQELILGRHDQARAVAHRRAHHGPAAVDCGAAGCAARGAGPRLARVAARAPLGAPRTAYTRVRPNLIVEVSADLALDGLRWRHPARFVRPPA
jgi:hypothetical protein